MNDPILKKAKKRVKAKKGFFVHTGVMAAVSVFLMFIVIFDGDSSSSVLDMAIPIAAMALSVVIHYVSVWGIPGLGQGGQEWEANELEKEYLRLKRIDETKKNLSDEEYLELKELQRRYKDEDFV